jgi:hypothetical protein
VRLAEARERILREVRAEVVSSSRGRVVERGVKRKMSPYPLRPRRRARTKRQTYRIRIVHRHPSGQPA